LNERQLLQILRIKQLEAVSPAVMATKAGGVNLAADASNASGRYPLTRIRRQVVAWIGKCGARRFTAR
jgi:hypothetical protein